MKKVFLLCSVLISCILCNAQSKARPDLEKLLDYYQTQRYAEATEYLQGVYKEDTKDPKEITQLAYAYLMAGRLIEAEANYLKLYNLEPANLSVLLNLANLNRQRGNKKKAEEFCIEILKADSTNFAAYKQLADLSELETERINYLKKANAVNPNDADIAFNLCKAYLKMDKYTDAQKVLEPALAADSANLRLLRLEMPIYVANKNYNESIQTGQKLLSYGDSSTFILNNLAKSYYSILDYQNALKYFLAINDKTDDAETLYYNIGLSYRGVKDYKNAIPYLQKGIKTGVSNSMATYYGLLGDSFENINKSEDANTAYKKGLQFENKGNLLYKIAMVYETQLNDKKNAINYYEQYLKTLDAKKQARQIIFIKNKIADLKK